MQKFGIEIRKVGNLTSLYADVDAVLTKYCINDSTVGDEIKVQTVAHSLHKMLKVQSYFDVCTIKNCADVCQICIDSERMKIYSSIHCMHWNDMISEYRLQITAMVLDDFRMVLNKQ